jgi:hypothetical protein
LYVTVGTSPATKTSLVFHMRGSNFGFGVLLRMPSTLTDARGRKQDLITYTTPVTHS